ncbi:hypothetical protein GA0070622_6435 [Micromonospora sediminicola]|uniref:Uncharacterized protein n=1 Tax=Micromonospora sediminicola TaxID=946078 RepID=A0A1A9BIH2_9ACTN|nr:hypothetical protein [Micromonospora sediminicola]SBT69310.1 hypothetical protein GA0070622_6435 [Micromonospora sediminicola]
MAADTEREIETPCGWCGNTIVQPPTGRKKRYCDRSCRQRAYELRTAQRRHQADVDAGRIRTVPAQRVVERTIRPRPPRTAAQWETTLAELADQLYAGRHPWDRHRIRAALNGVLLALGEEPLPERHHTPPATFDDPHQAALDDATSAAAVALLVTFSGATTDTTLTRLAESTGHPAPAIRAALERLAGQRLATLRRHDRPVDDVAGLAEHARFQLWLPTPAQAAS